MPKNGLNIAFSVNAALGAEVYGWLGKVGSTKTGTHVFVWQLWARVAFCGREMEIYKKGDVTVVR